MLFSRQFLKISIVMMFSLALPASAQEVRWKVVNILAQNHSTHGNGIEIHIKPDPVPDGLFDSPNLPEIMAGLCTHFAPPAIAFVKEKDATEAPDFIAVRIISGGMFGRYVLTRYAISEGGCGDEL